MTDRSDGDATADDAPAGLDALGIDVGAMVGSAFASDATLDEPVEELPPMRPTLGYGTQSAQRTPVRDAPELPRVEPIDEPGEGGSSEQGSGAVGASSDRIASLLAAGIDSAAPSARQFGSGEIVRPSAPAAETPSDRDTVELPRDERLAPLEGEEDDSDDDVAPTSEHSRFGELGKSVGSHIPPSLRNRRAVLLGGGVVALIVVLVFVLTSNGSPQPTVVADPVDTTAPVAPTSATGAADAAIPVKSATARCPAGSTKGDLATDGQMNTAWVCVTAGIPAGQVLTLDLGGLYSVSALGIVPGFNAVNPDGSDEWIRHRVVKLIDIYFYGAPGDAGATQTPESLDTRAARNETVAKFRQPHLASQIKIMIRSTIQPTGNPQTRPTGTSGGGLGLGLGTTGPTQPAAGTGMGDFAVSSITVYGHEAR